MTRLGRIYTKIVTPTELLMVDTKSLFASVLDSALIEIDGRFGERSQPCIRALASNRSSVRNKYILGLQHFKATDRLVSNK